MLASRDPLFETNHAACDSCGLRNCDPAHARKAHTACSGCGLRKCAEDFVTEEHMKCAGCREMLCASEIEHISCPGCHRYSCKEIDQYDTYNHTLNDYGRYPCLDYPEEPEPEVTPEPTPTPKPTPTPVSNLDEFIAALEKGGEITLGASFKFTSAGPEIPAGKAVTINLNNHNIETNSGAAITNNGTLTIKGSGEVKGPSGVENNGILKIEGGTYTATNGAALSNKGTATLSGGTFNGDDPNEAAVINNGTMTINSGTTVNSKRHSIESESEGTLTINGGTFTLLDSSTGSSPSVLRAKTGKVKVNGGTFISQLANAAGVVSAGGEDDTIEVTINGGTFTCQVGSPVLYAVRSVAVIYVKGGSFSGPGTMASAKKTAKIEITGGTFNKDPGTAYVASGYKATGNDTDGWKVEIDS